MQSVTGTFRQRYDEFATRLTAAGGYSTLTGALEDVVAIAQGVLGATHSAAWVSARVSEAFPALLPRLEAAGIRVRVPEDPGAVRDAPLGIAVARLAIAETGSVLLHENDLANRSISLMTQQLIVLCSTEFVVSSLDDASPVLREIAAAGPSYATFVTGPSRTADIERELAVGVQGPGVLHVVFIAAPPS
jgi:L-lactate dehydrogenase complex protein LldG